MTSVIRFPGEAKGECSFDGCGREILHRDLCDGHYRQRMSGQELRQIRTRRKTGVAITVCSITGCDRGSRSLTLCGTHYFRASCFSLSPMQLDMLSRIEKCDCCGGQFSFSDLDIDHDHACCGKSSLGTCGECTRGLICRACNLGLGKFGDDADHLRKAANYLEIRSLVAA